MNNLKNTIVKQSLKINELNDEINTLKNLLKKCVDIINKNEPPGLLMDVLGRKLLLELLEKEQPNPNNPN